MDWMIGLIFFFFIFQIINVGNLLGNSFVVAGFPIWTWVIYGFYLLSYGSVFLYLFGKNDRKGMFNCTLIFAFSVVCVHIASVFYGASLVSLLRDSYHYVLPIFMYPMLYRRKDHFATFWKFVKILVVVNFVISVAFLTGILGALSGTSYISMLSRSSTLIDGGLGVLSFAIGLYCLFYENEMYSKKEAWLFLIAGVVITLSGQSRARILTVIFILALFYFMSALGKNRSAGKRFSWTNAILLAIIIGTGALIFSAESQNSLIAQIFDRFSLAGTDNSSIYRVYERETQLEIFKANPIIGRGWGAYTNIFVVDTRGDAQVVNNHNMYTTLLGYGGLVLAAAYLLWFAKLTKGIVRRFSTRSIEQLHIMLLAMILILSFSSAGFNKGSMILAVTMIYVNLLHEKRKRSDEG